jgi:hypothetical protein
MHPAAKYFSFIGLVLTVCESELEAQVIVSGKVYDSTGTTAVGSVSVISNSGHGTITNSNGYYKITVSEKDTIWFSYLGQRTKAFPVSQIWNLFNFDVSLKMGVPVLREVKVKPKYYKIDSIENRANYASIFNYKRPTFSSIVTSFGLGVTIDINELIRAFQVKEIRKSLKFQKRLIQQEKEVFISRRFNKQLVYKLTGLQGNALDSFMVINRPTYEFTLRSSDYEFREYIKKLVITPVVK